MATGYIDLNRRFFDPLTGRFTSIDPVTEGQEDQSTYQYSWNNPILKSDPNGTYPDGPGDDGFLIAKLGTTAFYDIKHALYNTAFRFTGAPVRASYAVENGHQEIETAYSIQPSANSLSTQVGEAINAVADIGTMASAGASGGPGGLLVKTSGNQVIKGIKNAIDGLRREAEALVDLAQQFPNASIQSERLLRTADGKKAIDPLTKEGRRIDHAVVENGKVTKLVETTSTTAPKAAQIAKENRIREAGGTYIRNKETKKLMNVSDIITELSRRK